MFSVAQLSQRVVASGAGEIGGVGVLNHQERSLRCGTQIAGVAMVRLVEVAGIDIGVVKEPIGSVGGGARTGGCGNTLASMIQGSLDNLRGALIEAFVTKIKRI